MLNFLKNKKFLLLFLVLVFLVLIPSTTRVSARFDSWYYCIEKGDTIIPLSGQKIGQCYPMAGDKENCEWATGKECYSTGEDCVYETSCTSYLSDDTWEDIVPPPPPTDPDDPDPSPPPVQQEFWYWLANDCESIVAESEDACRDATGEQCYESREDCMNAQSEDGWNPFMAALRWFFEMLSKLLLTILIAIMGTILFVFTALIALALFIFNATIGSLIAVPIIRADIVVNMWGFVRDFANLFFLLFFVIIGLATILRIESYKYQKTLPLLIIMALLVNFSLILVGLIVDMGNIITMLFVDGVSGQVGGWNAFIAHGETYFSGITKIWGIEGGVGNVWAIGMGYISYGIVLTWFYLLAVAIFWIIIFLFVTRIAILWILAILAPLAFVSYIFDVTRKVIWTRWLKNLIQWSFIAVPILFFMLLGFVALEMAPDALSGIVTDMGVDIDNISHPDMSDPSSLKSPTNGFQGFIRDLVGAMITPMVALIMMLVGIMISMTLIPEGAQAAIDAGKQSGTWIAQKGRRTAPVTATEKRFRERLEKTPFRALVGGRGAWEREVNKEKEEQKKLLIPMSSESREAYVNDKTLDQRKKYAAAAALFDLNTDKNKPIKEEFYNEHKTNAERGGADIGRVYAQNPTYRIDNDDEFEKTVSGMSWKDAEGLTHHAFESNPSDPNHQKNQYRIVKLLERLTMYSEQQVRRLSENMDPKTRRAVINAMDIKENNDAIWEAAKSDEGIKKGIISINTHFAGRKPDEEEKKKEENE